MLSCSIGIATIATTTDSIVVPRKFATGNGLAVMVDSGSTDAEAVTCKGFSCSSCPHDNTGVSSHAELALGNL